MTFRVPYLLALFVAAGCGIDVPNDPTWTEDVRPILAANCIRCHSVPATGGAPDTFRLDSFEDTFDIDGKQVRGAASMARFIAIRAGEMGEMPPDYPRTDGQRDILINWWARAEELGFPCDDREGFCPDLGQTRPSRNPDAIALDLPATADSAPVTIAYEISDADGDLVNGDLLVGSIRVSSALRDGRGEVTFDPSSLPTGPSSVFAELTDDIDTVSINLGTIDIDHVDGNTTPRVMITSPERNTLITDSVDIVVEVTDVDPGTPPSLDLIAFRGTDERVIAEDVAIDAMGIATHTWADTTAVAPVGTHSNWRIRAVVPDGSVTGIGESDVFVVSNETTALTYADVSGIISQYCNDCHDGFSRADIPNLFDPRSNLLLSAGNIYRRVVQQQTMPPPSAPGVLDGYTTISDADRATLGEYLLGGSPE